MRAVHAELRKLIGLPGVWVAVGAVIVLLKVTPLARYLPDLAGAGLLLRDVTFEPLPPVTGGVVMWVWVVGLWLLAGALFVRRDV